MAELRVSTHVIRRRANELRILNERFKREVNSLSGDVHRLGTMWEGDAKGAFMTAYRNDEAQFRNFYTGINQFVETLMQIADNYDRAEAANQAIGQTRKA